MNFKFLNLTLFLFTSIGIWSQTEASTNLIVEGNELHNQEEYIKAESEYRKSISLSPNRSEAFHNLGNTNYRSASSLDENDVYLADYKKSKKLFRRLHKNTLEMRHEQICYIINTFKILVLFLQISDGLNFS